MNTLRVPFKKTQRGATLIIALLLMVMIAMYGIPAAMNSMQNERMTGNTRQRDLAFQAAEHTLRAVEGWFLTQNSTTLDALAPAAKSCSDTPDDADPGSGDGILPNGECHANDAAYWNGAASVHFDWTTYGKSPSESPISAAALDSALVAAQPRYVVERMPNVCKPSGTAPPCSSPNTEANYYRITARGIGQDSNAVVILQTMYAFEPPPPSP